MVKEIEEILKKAYLLDQEPRQKVMNYMQNTDCEIDSDLLLAAITDIDKNDSTNRMMVFPIIDTIVCHDLYDLLSAESINTCWLVIQHSNIEDHLKYKRFVEELAERSLISSFDYMAYIDRCKKYVHEKQMFGTNVYRFPDNKFILYPVDYRFQNNWNELGEKFDLSRILGDKIALSHPIVKLEDGEYAIMGVAYWENTQELKTVSGAELFLDGEFKVTTDNTGYFSIITNKLSSAPSLLLRHNGKEHKIEYNYDQSRDYSIILFFLQNSETQNE